MDCAGLRLRVLNVIRIEGGGRPFEGLSGICSSGQLMVTQWPRGLRPGQ